MRYISLCSGSKGNCSLILHKDTMIMIDCGNTQRYIKNALEELKLSLENVDAIFVTHNHSDHIKSVNLGKGKPIYSCAEIQGVKQIQPLEPLQIKDLKLTPLPLSHDAPNTCGFLIESGWEKLVYMTDTGYVPKRLMKLIQNADYYFIESNHDLEMLMNTDRPQYIKARIYSDQGHLCNEDCASVLDHIIGPSTKEIILAHLSEEANEPSLALKVTQERLKNHPLVEHLEIKVAKQYEIVEGGEIK